MNELIAALARYGIPLPDRAQAVEAAVAGALVVLALAIGVAAGRALDVMSVGDDEARSLGLSSSLPCSSSRRR